MFAVADVRSHLVTALVVHQTTRHALFLVDWRSVQPGTYIATCANVGEADPGGLNAFVQFLSNGGTVEAVKAIFLGSAEYFARVGGSNDAFLTALYRDVLGRAIDPTGSAGFGGALVAGISRVAVASAIVISREANQDLVQSFYVRFLRRPADDFGLNSFVSALEQGGSDQLVIAAIVGSNEYLGRL